MKILFVLLLAALILAVAPASAAVKACTTARVTAGDCPSTSQTLVMYAIDTTVLTEVADEIADVYGWPSIICTETDITAGRCAAGQLGQRFTTAETKNNFANRKLGELIRAYVVSRRKRLAAAAAEAGVALPGAIE